MKYITEETAEKFNEVFEFAHRTAFNEYEIDQMLKKFIITSYLEKMMIVLKEIDQYLYKSKTAWFRVTKSYYAKKVESLNREANRLTKEVEIILKTIK